MSVLCVSFVGYVAPLTILYYSHWWDMLSIKIEVKVAISAVCRLATTTEIFITLEIGCKVVVVKSDFCLRGAI